MDSVLLLSLAIFAPAFFGTLGMVAPRRAIWVRVVLAVLGPVASLIFLTIHLAAHGLDAGPVGVAWMPSVQLELAYNPDRLGMFFALLVAGVGLLITLYARAYFGPDQGAMYRIYPSLLLFMTAMLGLVLADNFVLLLLFWELTSISSFLLIGWERDDAAAVKNALQAFIVTGTGGIALLGGLILLGLTSGQWSFSSLAAAGDLSDWRITAAFVLIFAGAVAKSAQWPLHFWLPAAMAAPTPVSAYLHSATMVKAGVYLLGRLADPLADLTIWPWLLLPVGAVTMVLGAYLALRRTDLKQIFAYTTVSQLGLLVCMYGLAAFPAGSGNGVVWDVTQILNHALYKAPLFILAGAIAHIYYSRDLRDLYGLFYQGRTERLLAILMLLATYAMAAGPLTLGFTAKEFFLYGVWDAYKSSGNAVLLLILAAVAVQAALNVTIFIRFVLTLLGPESTAELQPPHDPDAEEERIAYEDYHAIQTGFWAAMLWIPAAVLVALQYLAGIAPMLVNPFLRPLESNLGHFDSLPGLWYAVTHPGLPLGISLLAILAGVAMAIVPGSLGLAPVWRRSRPDWHERLFPWFYALATKGGGRVFGLIQTGNVRTYLGVICAALILLIAWAAWASGARPNLSAEAFGPISWSERLPIYAIGTLACIGALLMPLIQHRGGRVMILGTVGYSVAGLFYFYSAPDLALTQVSIEIVALVLFLLALGLLPRTLAMPREPVKQVVRLALAIGVALAMFWLTLSSSLEQRPPMSLLNADGERFKHPGEFFLRNANKGQDVVGRHPGGGGNNVVNVILVDFRGLDTFGEITVLSIAALGVLLLLHRRPRSQQVASPVTEPASAAEATPAAALPPAHDAASLPSPEGAMAAVAGHTASHVPGAAAARKWVHGLSLTSEPLRVATKLIVPLSLLFAFFIFFKGHQLPGGGFVAGLVSAIALIAHRMAHGRASLRHMVPIRPRRLMAGGLLLTLAAGMGPVLLARPFLTSRFGYVTIPGVRENIEWTTALVFDLGVFLVVLGVVMAMINALSEESEAK